MENLRAMQRAVDCSRYQLERLELADQRAAELSRQRALLADLLMRESLVLSLRRLAQVRRSVRKHRLLTEQQRESEQDANQDTLDSHPTLVLVLVQYGKRGILAAKSTPCQGDFKACRHSQTGLGAKEVRRDRGGARIPAVLRSDQEETR